MLVFSSWSRRHGASFVVAQGPFSIAYCLTFSSLPLLDSHPGRLHIIAIMMLASPCSRAVRALAPIGKKSCSRALVSASGVPVESNCASIPALLPGTFKERQWTWEHHNDGSAEVQVSMYLLYCT